MPKINIAEEIDVEWSSTLRTGAFVILLLRAGLGLKLDILRKNKVRHFSTMSRGFFLHWIYIDIWVKLLYYKTLTRPFDSDIPSHECWT